MEKSNFSKFWLCYSIIKMKEIHVWRNFFFLTVLSVFLKLSFFSKFKLQSQIWDRVLAILNEKNINFPNQSSSVEHTPTEIYLPCSQLDFTKFLGCSELWKTNLTDFCFWEDGVEILSLILTKVKLRTLNILYIG